MPATPLCLKCGAPVGDATASPKPLILGVAWAAIAVAASSHLSSIRMPSWSQRALVASVLAVIPIAYFFRAMSRARTHWRCMRCKAEFLR